MQASQAARSASTAVEVRAAGPALLNHYLPLESVVISVREPCQGSRVVVLWCRLGWLLAAACPLVALCRRLSLARGCTLHLPFLLYCMCHRCGP